MEQRLGEGTENRNQATTNEGQRAPQGVAGFGVGPTGTGAGSGSSFSLRVRTWMRRYCRDAGPQAEEGRQELVSGRELVYGQSVTEACLGWDDSVQLLESLAEQVRRRRKTRLTG